jgi:Helix-turn-helix domain
MFARRGRAKIFGRGQGRPLDRNAKARIMTYARAWSARNKVGRQHKGPMTRAYMEVLWALLYRCHNSKTGFCFPSLKTIAERAECAVDTVNEAIKVMERAGFLTWAHQIYRKDFKYKDEFGQILTGTTMLRGSNVYVFTDLIGPEPMLTEIRTGKLDKNLNNTCLPVIQRKIDPNDQLELALGRLKTSMEAKRG